MRSVLVDIQFFEAVSHWDTLVLLKGARQTGKTSLTDKRSAKTRETGVKVVLTDFQIESLESFFMAVGEMIADQLDMDVCPQDNWRIKRSPTSILRDTSAGRF